LAKSPHVWRSLFAFKVVVLLSKIGYCATYMHTLSFSADTATECITAAMEVLVAGGLVVYPTETAYGIAADATNPTAVAKLLQFKHRQAGRAISVCVEDKEAAERLVVLNDVAEKLYTTFLPGPLTVISQDRGVVDSRLVSELGTVGIRISSHPFVSGLALRFNRPFTATAASPAGGSAPYSVEVVQNQLRPKQQELIDLIIDAGPLPRRATSTVIDTTQDAQHLVRSGGALTQTLAEYVTQSEEETRAIATKIVQRLLPELAANGVLLLLEGEMGAGKTHFAQGVGVALGVTEHITSPTYTVMSEYQAGKNTLIHMDLWRLEHVTPAELELNRVLTPHHFVLIEWPLPLLEHLSGVSGYRLLIEHVGETERRLTLAAL
jgi:L-threonylcarbamoyladenylate synthase